MKKIYLSALALSIGALSFGQQLRPTANTSFVFKNKQLTKHVTKETITPPNDKAAVLWSNDFSTIADWALTNTSSPAQNWIYTTDVNDLPVSNDTALFTTGSNGYLYIDSDGGGASATQNVTATIVAPIDLSSAPAAILIWEQNFMHFNEVFTVGISNDNGSSWTDFIIDNGPVISPQSPDVNKKSLNISTIAGGFNQVLVRFNYQGAFDWYWAIDDVRIEEPDNNEIITNNAYYGFDFLQYSRIPADHVRPADFSAFALNGGGVIQPNTVLTVREDGIVIATGTPADLAVAASDSISAPSYTPTNTTIGTPHVFELTISSDSTDITPLDNIVAFAPFEFTTATYALDDYGANGVGNGGGENGPAGTTGEFEFEAGNYYDAVINDVAGSIEVVVGTDATAGAFIDVVLYEVDAAGAFIEVSRSDLHTVTASDIGNTITLSLTTVPNPAITAGTTYFAAVHSAFTEFFYGTSGSSPDGQGTAAQASLIFYPDMVTATSSFFTTQTPMVRLITEPSTVSVNEINSATSFNVFPNPSTGEFNINLDANISGNVILTVKNIVGQTIINKTVKVAGKTTETISLSDYSKGVYFLTIGNETVKLIVE